METPAQPDIERLVTCADRMAAAMEQPAPDRAQTTGFLQALLFDSKSDGGKDVWPSLQEGLLTELEARNLVMAHCATWLSTRNRVPEPSCDLWGSEKLEAAFDDALFGRPARV